jgi:hypothetical protein
MQLSARDTLSPFAARAFGLALIIAPLLLLASTIAYITEGEKINHGVLGGTIGVWSVFAIGFAMVGLFRMLEPHAPRASIILTLMIVMVVAGGTAFNIQGIFVALYDVDFMNDTAITGSDTIAILAFLPWGLFMPITMIATGVVLWRTRAVARPVAILFAAAGILFVASRPEQINVLAIFSDLVFLAAMAPLGWAVLNEGRAPQSESVPEPVA